MKLPIRFKLRALLVIVGLVALAFGVSIEWHNHRDRDRYAEDEAKLLKQVTWHYQQILYCRSAEASRVPYSRGDRMKLWDQHTEFGPSQTAGLLDWDREARTHEYWAMRLGDQAEGITARKLDSQRRLLFP